MGWGTQPGGVPRPGVPHLGYPHHWTWWGGGVPDQGCPTLGTPTIGPGGGGYTPTGGCPSWVPLSDLAGGRGYPDWGVPHLEYPLSDLAGGCPNRGYPGTLPQVPPLLDLARGYPDRGGGTPPQITDGVLDTPRSVCLLRSRRRTFLFSVPTVGRAFTKNETWQSECHSQEKQNKWPEEYNLKVSPTAQQLFV